MRYDSTAKKIAIMTHWWANDNYGQTLQAFALQEYLRDKGFQPYLIRYHPDKNFLDTVPIHNQGIKKYLSIKKYLKFLKYWSLRYIHRKEYEKLIASFKAFKNQYITQSNNEYFSHSELKNNPPDSDYYVVGSDQVWNFSFTGATFETQKDMIHAFCLDFGNDSVKKIAVAASFGDVDDESVYATEIFPLLKKLNHITVREYKGVELLKRHGITAELMSDTAFLLSAEDYRKLYSNENVKNRFKNQQKKYCLIYRLGNNWNVINKEISTYAEKNNLEIITICQYAEMKWNQIYPSIQEWLYLVDNAEMIFTNSFHGSVFSMIFDKKFRICCDIQKNKRIQSLLHTTGILSEYQNYYKINENQRQQLFVRTTKILSMLLQK